MIDIKPLIVYFSQRMQVICLQMFLIDTIVIRILLK